MATTLETAILAAAQAAHEAHRAYRAVIECETGPDFWHATSQQREATQLGVVSVWLGDDAKAAHVAWMKLRQARGWGFGPVYDQSTKTHPDMMDYDDLPESTRRKRDVFVETAGVLLSALGYAPPRWAFSVEELEAVRVLAATLSPALKTYALAQLDEYQRQRAQAWAALDEAQRRTDVS